MPEPAAPAAIKPLPARERRVLGVLIEKAKTTPDAYPMSINALSTGCNQKTNRHPLTNYDPDDVEEILQDLRQKGLTIVVDSGGRVMRWKHTLYQTWGVSAVELAVLGELLLRGPQTEGDLRSRANRMCEREPMADLAATQKVIAALVQRGLMLYLTPPGQRRGMIVTHGFHSPEELEKHRKEWASREIEDDSGPAESAPRAVSGPAPEPAWKAEMATLRAELDDLRTKIEATPSRTELDELRKAVQGLRDELRALKDALGA